MKAMRLAKAGPVSSSPLAAVEMDPPAPGPGEILIAVAACGVCRTDLHTVEGDLALPKLPITPGHQVVGRVSALGAGASRFALGERVGVAWLSQSCGGCQFCRQGLENLCPEASFTGLHRDGGYGELMVVHEAFAFAIPALFSDEEAAPLLCAGIIGYRSLKLSGIQPGGRLGLYGFGASAHLALQVANHWGCRTFVFSRGEAHRRQAVEMGAVWAGSAGEQPPEPLDGSVTFAPAGRLVPMALGHLRPGGTLAINAVHMSDIPRMGYDLLYGERVLRSVANFTREDGEEFLRLAAEIPVRPQVSCFPLAEANQVLAMLKRSEINGAAVLTINQENQWTREG